MPRGTQQVVAALGLYPRGVSRNVLAGLLWPETSDRRAHGALRTRIWRLQNLCSGLVRASDHELALGADVVIDVQEVRQRGAQLLATPSRVDDATLALVYNCGELLPGWYEDWVLLHRERLRQLHLHVLEVVAHHFARCGWYGAALEAALTAVGSEPLRESAHRVVIQIHLAEGNLSEALKQYETYRDLLWRELAASPSPSLHQLIFTGLM